MLVVYCIVLMREYVWFDDVLVFIFLYSRMMLTQLLC